MFKGKIKDILTPYYNPSVLAHELNKEFWANYDITKIRGNPMSEIDKKGKYIAHIPYDDMDRTEGVIILKSNNKRLNDFLESHLRKLLRDIDYGRCEEFEL